VKDEDVTREFGDLLLTVLEQHGFREVGRYVDDLGWFTRTYFNGKMGVRLVYHLGTSVELMPRRSIEAYTSIQYVGDFLNDPVRDDSNNDEKAQYLERNLPRLERLFGELDGGRELRQLQEYRRRERAKHGD
jgi:hypothetical protein